MLGSGRCKNTVSPAIVNKNLKKITFLFKKFKNCKPLNKAYFLLSITVIKFESGSENLYLKSGYDKIIEIRMDPDPQHC